MNIGIHQHIAAEEYMSYAKLLATLLGKDIHEIPSMDDICEDYVEQHAIDLLLISTHNERRSVRRALSQCRDLRIPYIILTPTTNNLNKPQNILLPVTMLEEEIYKVEIASHLCRHADATALILTAHDYGSKARQTTQKMQTYMNTMQVTTEHDDALKDSFHLYKEVTDRQREFAADMVIWTASREYGLDDILFGPPEQHLIQRLSRPCLLVNPREDLFSLCD